MSEVTVPTVSQFATRIFAWAALLCGIGAVVLSHTWLTSDDTLQIVSGSVELLAGMGLIAISLIVSFPSYRLSDLETNNHAIGCLKGLIPGATAAAAWLVIFFSGGVPALLSIPMVLLFCFIWAWNLSPTVSTHFMSLMGWKYPARTRTLIFIFQVVTILASWPAFGHFLQLLEWMGYHIPFND